MNWNQEDDFKDAEDQQNTERETIEQILASLEEDNNEDKSVCPLTPTEQLQHYSNLLLEHNNNLDLPVKTSNEKITTSSLQVTNNIAPKSENSCDNITHATFSDNSHFKKPVTIEKWRQNNSIIQRRKYRMNYTEHQVTMYFKLQNKRAWINKASFRGYRFLPKAPHYRPILGGFIQLRELIKPATVPASKRKTFKDNNLDGKDKKRPSSITQSYFNINDLENKENETSRLNATQSTDMSSCTSAKNDIKIDVTIVDNEKNNKSKNTELEQGKVGWKKTSLLGIPEINAAPEVIKPMPGQ